MYLSTRNDSISSTASLAVLRGAAPDGGLYMPEAIKPIPLPSIIGKSARELSAMVLSNLLDDFTEAEIKAIVERAYADKFETEDITPLVKVADRYVLELFRGPTCAFKDVALSVLPHLMSAAREKNGIKDEILVLTATSGDTGKAALEGFCNVPGARIMVFYPEGGVSDIQRTQMVTQQGSNVYVCAVRGNFDDAQTGVKSIFSLAGGLLPEGIRLSSANSINIGRLAPQVMYYFKAYADLVGANVIRLGDEVEFTVPTGNFGDILAGYLAKRMGLPVSRFICASNSNDVLTDFIRTGVYDKNRTFHKTLSPSMDILVSSNLERLLYLLSGCSADETALYMSALASRGRYEVSDAVKEALTAEFTGESCSDAQTVRTIREVFENHGYLMDTHTAVAWHAAELSGDRAVPSVVLSTASPYKFAGAVAEALGIPDGNDGFALMRSIEQKTRVPIPKSLAELSAKKELHFDTVDIDEMLRYVLDKAGSK